MQPKADVYLLADTTASMGPIIGAVQAGILTVVNDPAFAPFDVAWGAGNYKDFPIPTSSPYASSTSWPRPRVPLASRPSSLL